MVGFITPKFWTPPLFQGAMTLQQQQVLDLQEIMDECGNPTFTNFDGTSYPCKGSTTELSSPQVNGGFSLERLLTMTVPLYAATRSGGTVTLVSMFGSNPIPKSQKVIQYKGDSYRIRSVKRNVTDAYLRVIAIGTTKGF